MVEQRPVKALVAGSSPAPGARFRNKIMYIKVFVTPSAKRERVEEKGETLAIAVKEPAQGNHANRRVREIVAARRGVPFARVRILSGHRARGKMLVVTS